jgi:hypothetical protein
MGASGGFGFGAQRWWGCCHIPVPVSVPARCHFHGCVQHRVHGRPVNRLVPNCDCGHEMHYYAPNCVQCPHAHARVHDSLHPHPGYTPPSPNLHLVSAHSAHAQAPRTKRVYCRECAPPAMATWRAEAAIARGTGTGDVPGELGGLGSAVRGGRLVSPTLALSRLNPDSHSDWWC